MKKPGSGMMKHYLFSRCRMVDWLLRQAKSFSRSKKKKEYQADSFFLLSKPIFGQAMTSDQTMRQK